MISSEGFKISKDMARLPLGREGRDAYIYLADTKRQWEWSYSSDKAMELIGTQSMAQGCIEVIKDYLGELSNDEEKFCKSMRSFNKELAQMISSVKHPVDPQLDIYETIFDMRIINSHINSPRRILDIGPGAGRHMQAAFLNSKLEGNCYVGIESIGLPYHLQNLGASLLCVKNPSIKFFDGIDYQFAREDLPDIMQASSDTIYHLPLWMAQALPEKYFDLILCNYVLDELPANDFLEVSKIAGRCLADDGIVYSRGSQQRAMTKDMYLYGYGTFHGQDITKNMLAQGLETKDCQLISSEMTRIFVRSDGEIQQKNAEGYVGFMEDIPLVEKMQSDFISSQIEDLKAAGSTVVVWDDKGYSNYQQLIAPYMEGVNVVGITYYSSSREGSENSGIRRISEMVNKISPTTSSELGALPEIQPEKALELRPDVFIISSVRGNTILKKIQEMFEPEEYRVVQKFNDPVTFIYREL